MISTATDSIDSGASDPRTLPSPLRRPVAARGIAFLALLAFLLVVRFEILDSPPYWDFAIGLWPEADYLADSGFDYRGLRDREHHSLDYHGGRRSYMTSVLPTLIALLMRTLPSVPATLVAYHLFVFACAAVVAIGLWDLFPPWVARPGRMALIAAALSTPLFAVQIDMAGMELPMVAGAVLGAQLFARELYVAAAAAGLLAFGMKGSALVVTLAATIVLAALVVLPPVVDRESRCRRAIGLGVYLISLAVQVGVTLWGTTYIAMLRARNPNLQWTVLWCPDLVILFGLTVPGALAALIWSLRGRRRHFEESLLTRLAFWIESARIPLLAGLVVALTLVAITRVPFVPRYLTLAVPFLYVVLGWILFPRELARVRAVGTALLGAIIAVNLVNWNGVLFPDQWSGMERLFGIAAPPRGEGSFLERSHEYLKEHRAVVGALRAIEREARDIPVLAGHPLDLALALPSMGYVKRPVRGYSINGASDATPHYREVSDLPADNPPTLIFTRMGTTFYRDSRFDIPAREPTDRVLFDGGADSILSFERPADRMPAAEAERREWYEERLFPGLAPGKRLAYLWQTGDCGGAIELAARRAARRPDDPYLPWLAIALLARAERSEEAAERARLVLAQFGKEPFLGGVPPSRFLRDEPGFRDANAQAILDQLAGMEKTGAGAWSAAFICLAAGWSEPAGMYFRAYLEQERPDVMHGPESVPAAGRALELGEIKEAEGIACGFLADPLLLAHGHNFLGLVALAKGKNEQALDHLLAACSANPRPAGSTHHLGIALARLGRFDEAAEQFAAAVAEDPTDRRARWLAEWSESLALPDPLRKVAEQ